jgi:hypothetical protein
MTWRLMTRKMKAKKAKRKTGKSLKHIFIFSFVLFQVFWQALIPE